MAMAPKPRGADGKTIGFQASEQCDLCCSSTPVKFCQECEFTLCPACATGHQKIKATKEHPLVDIDTFSSNGSFSKSGDTESRPSNCAKHQTNVLQFYCEECIEIFCAECCQDHQDHPLQPLNLKTCQNICTQHIKTLLDKTHDLEEKKNLIAGIFTTYDDAIQMVKKLEEELVKLVQESSRSLREDLVRAKKAWESVVNDNEKGLTKITTDVEHKLSELHSIRKVTDVDIFSSELAASQQLLEKVNNFMDSTLQNLTVPLVDDLLPNTSTLPFVEKGIVDLIAPGTIKTPAVIREQFSVLNLHSPNQHAQISLVDPLSYKGYRMNKSYSCDKQVMMHGTSSKDIRLLNLDNHALLRCTSKCEIDNIISTGHSRYVALRLKKSFLLNAKFEIIDTLTTDKICRGLSSLSGDNLIFLGIEENNKNLAHLLFVKIENDRFTVAKEKTVYVADEMKSIATDESKTYAFIRGSKDLYKINLGDLTTQHKDMSQWLQKKNAWCLCVVGDNLLIGDSIGQVHLLDTQLNYKKIILDISTTVRDIAVKNGYLVATSNENEVFLYK